MFEANNRFSIGFLCAATTSQLATSASPPARRNSISFLCDNDHQSVDTSYEALIYLGREVKRFCKQNDLTELEGKIKEILQNGHELREMSEWQLKNLCADSPKLREALEEKKTEILRNCQPHLRERCAEIFDEVFRASTQKREREGEKEKEADLSAHKKRRGENRLIRNEEEEEETLERSIPFDESSSLGARGPWENLNLLCENLSDFSVSQVKFYAIGKLAVLATQKFDVDLGSVKPSPTLFDLDFSGAQTRIKSFNQGIPIQSFQATESMLTVLGTLSKKIIAYPINIWDSEPKRPFFISSMENSATCLNGNSSFVLYGDNKNNMFSLSVDNEKPKESLIYSKGRTGAITAIDTSPELVAFSSNGKVTLLGNRLVNNFISPKKNAIYLKFWDNYLLYCSHESISILNIDQKNIFKSMDMPVPQFEGISQEGDLMAVVVPGKVEIIDLKQFERVKTYEEAARSVAMQGNRLVLGTDSGLKMLDLRI